MTDDECKAQIERGIQRAGKPGFGSWTYHPGELLIADVLRHALGWLDIIKKQNDRFWFHREKWMTECSRVEREKRLLEFALKVAKKEVAVSVLLQEYLAALGIEDVKSLFTKREKIGQEWH